MVNTDDPNATDAVSGVRRSATLNITEVSQMKDIDKYFISNILDILDSTDKKGKTKLKEIRRSVLDYLKRF